MSAGVVAVIDDEQILCEVLTEVLAAEGYAARGFASAQECLAATDAGFRPSLIFVDLRMRGLSGAGFVERLRQRPWGAAVHVYVVTGSMLQRDYPPRGSVDGVINKPFDLEEILEVAARHLERPGARQAGA